MASCIQSVKIQLRNGYDSLTRMLPDTNMPLSFSAYSNQHYSLDIARQEVVRFNISLVSNTQPTDIGVTVSFYQLDENDELISLGSVLITEMILDFQKDFTIGSYIICINSKRSAYTGTFKGYFTGFPIVAQLKLNCYVGQTLHPIEKLTVTKIPIKCNKLLYYSMLDGSLPSGLTLNKYGVIEGILPNLDCVDDNKDLSPSQNWYYDRAGIWQPWGRQWRFLVKVWVVEFPEATVEDWFCIRVYNNWSWDRDNFNPPFEHDTIEYDPVPEETPILPNDLCCDPAPEPKPFIPTPIPSKLCPCEEETPTEQSIQLNFLQWYYTTIKNSQTEENPYIQNFIDNFKNTDYFKQMMISNNLENELYTPLELELKAVQARIDYYLSQLNSGGRRSDDIDDIMLNLKNEENQKLPITLESEFGTTLEIRNF